MEQQYLDEVPHTQVSQELVELAAKYIGVDVEYRFLPGYTPFATVWAAYDTTPEKVDQFWAEYERLNQLITTPLAEYVLPDQYPLVQGYVYVVNGKPRTFIDGERMTVGAWKRLHIDGVEDVTEVRNCDVPGRMLRRPLEVEVSTALATALRNTPSNSKPKRRKGHKTFKIKNM